MPPIPRPELSAIRSVAHGAIGSAELASYGLSSDQVVDFSVNTNPLGPPPSALRALAALDQDAVARYPDPSARPLRVALAEPLGLDPAQIIAGNGSSELIWLLALVYAHAAPESVLIVGPTFGEYERACRLLGANVLYESVSPERQFQVDVLRLPSRIAPERPRLVWLCNPNNPPSRYLPRRDVAVLLEVCVAAGALLVVDEAYLPFVEHAESLLNLLPSGHLFLLRSLTKDYALAGLRLGYGIGTLQTIELLRAAQPPWSVGAPAQHAGLAAIADLAHLQRAQEEVQIARRGLVDALKSMGLHVVPPSANFVLVEVGDGAGLRSRLLPYGFVVRDCASFGLPQHIRIAVRTRDECSRLVRALTSVLEVRP